MTKFKPLSVTIRKEGNTVYVKESCLEIDEEGNIQFKPKRWRKVR